MELISKAHKHFLISLMEAEVEYMLIGGYAVIYHGYPRLTKDMDIWLKPDNENKLKLLPVLHSYGIVNEDIDRVKGLDFIQAQSFYIGEEKNKIDFLTCMAGVSYAEAVAQKVSLQMKNKSIPVISYKHLIVNKMLSDHPQDKADVAMLQKIRSHQRKK